MNDETFKALADPTRRRIMRLLGDREMTAGEIASQFDISAPSMSHHFGVLKSAGLINGRKEGQQIYYSLDTTVVQDLMAVLMDLLGRGKSEENP
ncbi:MAG TPA: autorepressor SdpR family transcription factor [Fimbriimonas sp.]|nr:autorepressor SdpR family transcription factor [Fimbriimonas sp.]